MKTTLFSVARSNALQLHLEQLPNHRYGRALFQLNNKQVKRIFYSSCFRVLYNYAIANSVSTIRTKMLDLNSRIIEFSPMGVPHCRHLGYSVPTFHLEHVPPFCGSQGMEIPHGLCAGFPDSWKFCQIIRLPFGMRRASFGNLEGYYVKCPMHITCARDGPDLQIWVDSTHHILCDCERWTGLG